MASGSDGMPVDVFETDSGRHYVALQDVGLAPGVPVAIDVGPEFVTFRQGNRALGRTPTGTALAEALKRGQSLVVTEMQGQSLVSAEGSLHFEKGDFL